MKSKAMEEESREKETTAGLVCSIVKPEPRTIKPEQPGSQSRDANIIEHKSEPSNETSRSFTSETLPRNAELNTQTVRKARWTSSPPSRRGSSAADGDSNVAADSAAGGASGKATDSPLKRRGKTT